VYEPKTRVEPKRGCCQASFRSRHADRMFDSMVWYVRQECFDRQAAMPTPGTNRSKARIRWEWFSKGGLTERRPSPAGKRESLDGLRPRPRSSELCVIHVELLSEYSRVIA
jgi:hypothetical protein